MKFERFNNKISESRGKLPAFFLGVELWSGFWLWLGLNKLEGVGGRAQHLPDACELKGAKVASSKVLMAIRF